MTSPWDKRLLICTHWTCSIMKFSAGTVGGEGGGGGVGGKDTPLQV